jgi:preprotein translocase subunit SecB
MKAKLRNIILTKTSFERDDEIDFNIETEYDTTIQIRYGIVENKHFAVEFEYLFEIFSIENNEEHQISYSSIHVAQFDLEEEIDLENSINKEKIQRFANINAAAMIYPFIRENAASISAKAGMSPIMIPVSNFIERYEKLNKESSDN